MATFTENPTVTAFSFKSCHQVRTVSTDDGLWFFSRDVCAAIGIENVSTALQKIPKEHLAFLQMDGLPKQVSIISVSGVFLLFALYFTSLSVEFIQWIRETVLTATIPPRPNASDGEDHRPTMATDTLAPGRHGNGEGLPTERELLLYNVTAVRRIIDYIRTATSGIYTISKLSIDLDNEESDINPKMKSRFSSPFYKEDFLRIILFLSDTIDGKCGEFHDFLYDIEDPGNRAIA